MTGARRLLVCLLLAAILAVPALNRAQAAPLAQDSVHIVQAGDTLSAIARKYGVTVQAMMAANGLANPSLIYIGQRLAIPGAPAVDAASANSVRHVVAAGETLSTIAQRYGVSVQALVEANGLADPSRIATGQQLTVPAAGAASAVPVAAPPTSTEYVVGAGDTLAGIAQQFNTTVSALASANAVSDPSQIRIGQRLVVPADASAPAAQAAPQGGLHFYVSISLQRCQLYRGEQLLYDWPCSTGRASSGTKAGEFYVQSKIREAWGSRWGFYMPFWLGIYWAGGSENGIHGLPYEPGGYPVWANAVGTPITYGCVLLGANESQTLWEMAYIGMPVTIRY